MPLCARDILPDDDLDIPEDLKRRIASRPFDSVEYELNTSDNDNSRAPLPDKMRAKRRAPTTGLTRFLRMFAAEHPTGLPRRSNSPRTKAPGLSFSDLRGLSQLQSGANTGGLPRKAGSPVLLPSLEVAKNALGCSLVVFAVLLLVGWRP